MKVKSKACIHGTSVVLLGSGLPLKIWSKRNVTSVRAQHLVGVLTKLYRLLFEAFGQT